MATKPRGAKGATQTSIAISARLRKGGRHVWKLPDEKPGTLAEIFASEDSRRQNLVLHELKRANAFRRCAEPIGVAVDPYDLILAVMGCINWHLNPLYRPADHRRELKTFARRVRVAATALNELSSVLDQQGRLGWSARLELSGLPDPTNPQIVKDLFNLATGIEGTLARGAFKDRGGRSKMRAFEHLILRLARIFEDATGRRAAITRDHYRDAGYSGRFWEFVEIVRPVAASIIETSGEGSLEQPISELGRGKYVEEALRLLRTEKSGKGPR